MYFLLTDVSESACQNDMMCNFDKVCDLSWKQARHLLSVSCTNIARYQVY